MLEKLGKRRYALPFAAFLVVACVMALVVYPMVTAEPKELPLGILSLDEGAETPQGALNAGEAIVEQVLESQDGAEGTPAVAWRAFDSQEALDGAIANEELYAAVVVPADFSASQVQAKAAEAKALAEQAAKMAAAQAAAAQAAAGGAPQGPAGAAVPQGASGAAAPQAEQPVAEIPEVSPLTLVVDEGKNPMAASTVETMLSGMLVEQGLGYEVERVDEADIGGGTLNMAQQFTVLPAFIMTMICSVVLFVMTRPARGASRIERWKSVGVQAALALCLSWLIGFGTTAIVKTSGLSIPALDTGLFLWLASLCLMLLFVGCLDVAVPLGAIAILGCFACGMACGNLPFELLPTFYQDWLHPWVPQRFIGDGVRQIFYTGASAANSAAGSLAWFGVLGAAALCAAPFMPRVGKKKVGAEQVSATE